MLRRCFISPTVAHQIALEPTVAVGLARVPLVPGMFSGFLAKPLSSG
ncbi:hypothetical protein [Geobacter argillaceus]|nr:hypothetical protein [Geobacter argillaceus]